MQRSRILIDEINMIGKLADLKDKYYQNTLAVSAMIELLIDKGLFTREELEHKAAQLDREAERLIRDQAHPIT